QVLAAVDFSTSSADAVSAALRIAQHTGNSECLALHVCVNGGPADDTQGRVDRFLAPLDNYGVKLRTMIENGSGLAAAAQNVAERENIDLIVMGSRGQTRSTSILLGGESEQMLMETRIPVLIVKRPGERIGLLKALLDREFRSPESPHVS